MYRTPQPWNCGWGIAHQHLPLLITFRLEVPPILGPSLPELSALSLSGETSLTPRPWLHSLFTLKTSNRATPTPGNELYSHCVCLLIAQTQLPQTAPSRRAESSFFCHKDLPLCSFIYLYAPIYFYSLKKQRTCFLLILLSLPSSKHLWPSGINKNKNNKVMWLRHLN